MSDPTESVTSAYTTIIIVAVVVPLAVTVIGLAIVFAYKRQREREFVPPSLANMPGMANSNLPITTPSLPVQVRHVRNVRNGTLLEWPSPSPDASHQGPGTQSSSHPEGESSEASPNPLLDPEARRNVRPELLPTPFNMTYSAAQPPYLVQPFYPPGSSLPYQMPPFGPQAPMLSSSTSSQLPPFPSQPSFMPTSSHLPQPDPDTAAPPHTQYPRAVNSRILMLVNDDASRSTSPSQATDDSSTLRGPRSMGSMSTMGEPVPQYEPFDSAVLTEEPERVADLRGGRQETMLPRYSQTNPFRRGLANPAP